MKTAAILLTFIAYVAQAQTPFSGDSAASYLRTLSVEIGPRPMGSPNERRAMEFASDKFREFGLREVYIMPMRSVESDVVGLTANTNSGIVVGVLRGETDRTIVIGGHIDSASPEIPGANDDGSGSATVIELARVLSKRPNKSTIVFCLFGGEEQGLRGSKYFVQHFPTLDKVALMFQIDMANGNERLVPLIDRKEASSPSWLVQAAFEEYAKLGYSGLSYPTHFFVFNNSVLPGGGIGSDHMPFLEKGIPAIDFTSDINDPIHTPQDNFALFKLDGLKRSGDLIYRLVEKFDSGVPNRETEEYYFWHTGGILFFIPIWAVSAFAVVGLGIGVWALMRTRSKRLEIDKSTRPKVPGLKLFLLMLIIQTCVWCSELVVGLIKGVRYPWFADLDGYFILGGFGGLLGIWLSLRIAQRIKISRDPYRYHLRLAIYLGVFVILFFLLSPKAALYPATALLLLSFAVLVPRTWMKLVLWALSPCFMYRFIMSEGFPLFSRTMPEAAVTAGLGFSVLWHLFLIVFFSAWAFPFLLGFATIYVESGRDLLWLHSFKQRAGLLSAVFGFLVCVLWLVTTPSYNEFWKQTIRIDETFDQTKGTGSIYLRSSEYLTGTHITRQTNDSLISTWSREVKVNDLSKIDDPWITSSRTIDLGPDSLGRIFNILATLKFKYSPYTVQLTYTTKKEPLRKTTSALAYTSTSRSLSLRWYSFPDTVLLVPVQFAVAHGDSVTESIEATFVQPIQPLGVEKALTNVITCSTVRQSSTFGSPK